MTVITCIVMTDGLIKLMDERDLFDDEEDETNFEELHQLYTTNPLILKEFSEYLNEQILFPDAEEKINTKRSKSYSKRSNAA